MSQPYELVTETAKILKNAYEVGFKHERAGYIIFYSRYENGEEIGVEYDENDEIDKKNITYLMSIINERENQISDYDKYWL